MGIDLRELFLMKSHRLASLIKNKEARAGGALINATNKDLLVRCHRGCRAVAGVLICDFAGIGSYWKRRSDLLCTSVCSSEALGFKASRSRKVVVAWLQSGYLH